MSNYTYFQTLYSRCTRDDGHIFLTQGPSKILHRFRADEWQLAASATENSKPNYIKYNLQDGDAVGAGSVGKSSTVKTVVSLGLDVDAGKQQFHSRDHVLTVLNRLACPPTMIVNSAGDTGGFHCYWVFEKPIRIQDEMEREFLASTFKSFEDMLREKLDGKLDSTANLDRLLRPAGSVNEKYDEPVDVVVADGRFYCINDLVEAAPVPEPVKPAIPMDAVPFKSYDDESIGTQFNQDVASTTIMASLMTSMGYEVWKSHKGDYHEFNRPGSESKMANGRFGDRSPNGNLQLVCWSPNTPFELNKSITLFAAYAALLHGGDMSVAASALVESRDEASASVEGYKEPEFLSKMVKKATAPMYAEREGGELEFPIAAEIDFQEGKVEKLPDELMRDGGWLEDCMNWVLSNSSIPLPELAFSSALHLLSLGCRREWRDTTQHQTCTNLFILNIAPTGSGKETPRRCIKSFLAAAEQPNLVGPDKLSSGPGLEGLVSREKATGVLIDEASDLIKAMCHDKAADYMASIAASLKVLYTASSSASYKGSCKVVDESEAVAHPHLSFYASTTPTSFFDSMSSDKITDGLIGRFSAFHAEVTKEDIIAAFGTDKEEFWIDAPSGLVEQWKALKDDADVSDYGAGSDGNAKEELSWKEVSRTPEARARFREHDLNIRLKNLDHDGEGQTVELSLWSRANEKTAKFALLFAISRWVKHSDAGQPVITKDDMDRAIALSNFLVRRLIAAVKQNVHDSEADKDVMKLLSNIAHLSKKSSTNTATSSELYRRAPLSRMKVKKTDVALLDLVQRQGYVAVVNSSNGSSYCLTEDGLAKVKGES